MVVDENSLLVQLVASTAADAITARYRAVLLKLQHGHEGLLRDLDRADPLHPALSFLLLFQQFAFPGHVPAIALCQDVLAHCRDRLAGDHLTANRGLER